MTHLEPSSTLPGMPLSGASRISFITLDDSLTRSFSFSPDAAHAEEIRNRPTTKQLVRFFIAIPRSDLQCQAMNAFPSMGFSLLIRVCPLGVSCHSFPGFRGGPVAARGWSLADR